jgi:sugar phosphate isomerase/epimerase
MQLGFVSAILPDLSLEEVFAFASEQKFACVELMCWPAGKAERRYAGVTHIDVSNFTTSEAAEIRLLAARYNVDISGLGYYPNPLSADQAEREVFAEHLKKVIVASDLLGVNVVNTFVGRDPQKSVDAQWGDFEAVWKPLVVFAESRNVNIGIENCPMLFSGDEWPGGKNLAVSPEIWARMFHSIPSERFGLNFDPSHLLWQHIDYVRCIREFGHKFVHVHAKDEKIDSELLYRCGVMGLGWHTPKLPGLGSVNWGAFFSALSDMRYGGAVCIEVEDRAYEGNLENRKRALRQSQRYLAQFMY